MASDGYPALGVCGMEELALAALLAAQHPALAVEPVEDIPDLHVAMLAAWRATSIGRMTSSATPTERPSLIIHGAPGVRMSDWLGPFH